MNHRMKTSVITFRVLLIFIAAAVFPRQAAAAKVFASMSSAPSTTNVTVGVATNVPATISLVDGNSGSTSVGNGSNCFYSVSLSPSDPTVTFSLSVTNFVSVKNATQTTTILTVTTTALTPANTYVATVWANNNPSNSAAITPISTTFSVTVASGGPFNPVIVWNPGGANTNWSTAGNWSPNGPPVSSNDVFFYDVGVTNAAGAVDNVADTSINIGSLTYGQTNNFHTTLVASGKTLTVGGDTNGLVVGTGTDPVDFQLTTAAITGSGGALVFNNSAATVFVSQSHVTQNNVVGNSQASLDLSGLDRFTATAGRVIAGADISIKGASGVLKLAKTNTVSVAVGSTAPQIDIGDNTQASGSPAVRSQLLLGQTNGVFADSIAVGRGKTDINGAMLAFNSAFSSPTAWFRGTNGSSSRVGSWIIGDGFGSRTYLAVGTCDFSLGTVNALVDTMLVGRGANASIANGANDIGTGTLTLAAGTIDVNTLEAGITIDGTGNGTINANGGTLLVNTLLELASGAGSTGTLNVSGGTVTTSTGVVAGTGTSTINVSGGVLNATNVGVTIGNQISPITSLNVTNSMLTLAAQKGAPAVFATSLSTDGAPNTVNVTAVPLITALPAQFPVIGYASSAGNLSSFVLGTLPANYTGFISNNVANSSIDLVITVGPVVPVYIWTGAHDANWNISSTDWKTNGVATTFPQGALLVQFDDSLVGSSSVNLTTALTVANNLFVSNSATNYIFSGTGSLTGNMSLSKAGSGSLTLAESGGDNFIGGIEVSGGTLLLDNSNGAIGGNTSIAAGTLQVGNNDAKGLLPTGNVALSGTLIFDRVDNVTYSNAISGDGVLAQVGSNILSLAGNSTFSGSAVVAAGTLQVGSANGLGLVGSITITNGGTLDVNDQPLFGNGNSNLVVMVSGTGIGGGGAIVNNSTNQTKVLHLVTLTGDATFGGTGSWDIRNSSAKGSPADAQLNGAFNLTKVGTNTVTIQSVTVDPGLENITVQAGTLDFNALTTSLGDPTATITVDTNATLTLDTLANVVTKNVLLNIGATLKGVGTNASGGPVTFSGPVSLAGPASLTANSGAFLLLTAPVSGAGGMTKNGAGVVFLGASNSYSGGTIVSGGVLALTNYNSVDSSITGSSNINVTSGATVDVTGRSDGTLTLSSGQTLAGGVGTNGPGLVNGIILSSAGSIISPGTGSTNTGVLSVSGNTTLQGTTVMKISAANGNDQLDAHGITYGGMLLVTNFSGTATNGQTFQLFVSATGYPGTFGSVILPSAPGLTWTNNLSLNGSITAGVILRPTITSINLVGGNVVIAGTNGSPGVQYNLLTTTNAALPVSQWSVLTTNTFAASTFNITNAVNTNSPQNFYLLRVR